MLEEPLTFENIHMLEERLENSALLQVGSLTKMVTAATAPQDLAGYQPAKADIGDNLSEYSRHRGKFSNSGWRNRHLWRGHGIGNNLEHNRSETPDHSGETLSDSSILSAFDQIDDMAGKPHNDLPLGFSKNGFPPECRFNKKMVPWLERIRTLEEFAAEKKRLIEQEFQKEFTNEVLLKNAMLSQSGQKLLMHIAETSSRPGGGIFSPLSRLSATNIPVNSPSRFSIPTCPPRRAVSETRKLSEYETATSASSTELSPGMRSSSKGSPVSFLSRSQSQESMAQKQKCKDQKLIYHSAAILGVVKYKRLGEIAELMYRYKPIELLAPPKTQNRLTKVTENSPMRAVIMEHRQKLLLKKFRLATVSNFDSGTKRYSFLNDCEQLNKACRALKRKHKNQLKRADELKCVSREVDRMSVSSQESGDRLSEFVQARLAEMTVLLKEGDGQLGVGEGGMVPESYKPLAGHSSQTNCVAGLW